MGYEEAAPLQLPVGHSVSNQRQHFLDFDDTQNIVYMENTPHIKF